MSNELEFCSILILKFFSEISWKEFTISLTYPYKLRSLSIKSSSILGFKVNLFKISLHLSTWLTKSSKSLLISFLSLNCSNKSWEIILIVDNGVPKEWAAAAACPPNDTNSCSFEITSWILSRASFLTFDSLPNVIAKKLKKSKATINAIGKE